MGALDTLCAAHTYKAEADLLSKPMVLVALQVNAHVIANASPIADADTKSIGSS